METGQVMYEASQYLEDIERKVRLAKKVRNTAMRLEREYSDLIDIFENKMQFCETLHCLHPRNLGGSNYCFSCERTNHDQ